MKWNYVIIWVSIAVVLCGCAKAPPPPPLDTTPPPVITGLVVSDAYNGKVVLRWEQNTAEDFDHYNVYLSKAEIINITGMMPVERITNVTTSAYQVTGLEDETKYYFAVTAVDDSGNESTLVAISATPVAKETLPPSPDTTPPETTIVSAPSETIGYGEVSFRWTGSDDSTTTADLVYSYKLEGYDAEYSPFTSDTSKTYIDLPDGSYVFHVKAQDTVGNIDLTPATSQFTIATEITGGLLILRNSEVNRIAVGSDGKSIYALDSVNAGLYKSSHGGFGWVDISAGIAGAGTWDELAVAPDTPGIVAVVTNARTEVYLSTNGGVAFLSMGLAANLAAGELIRCITVSPGYGGSARELAVGTSTGTGGGRVWVCTIPLLGWMDASSGAAGWLPGVPAIAGTDVFAVKYSPAFAGDKVILAVVSSGPAPDTDDTYLYIGRRDVGGTMTWNGNVFPGYPVEICRAGEDTPGSPLTYADLALPSDYLGSDIMLPPVYACWSDNPPGTAIAGNPNDDIYRLDDILCSRLYASGGSRESVISSLAYYGTSNEGKLLAGAMMGAPGELKTPVYFTFNPQSGFPVWKSSLKPPTGPNEAQVAWSPDGTVAYCGTSTIGGASHDQSAFSQSTTDGLSWNQTGLIDT
ncbi:MAG: fibronectin type III domain-containing protein [Dehalococcoidia bacterium]|nr:fibronectin type III domain-containing protein [Dehalococcoidia bacterium]